jgi:hypothetical protein
MLSCMTNLVLLSEAWQLNTVLAKSLAAYKYHDDIHARLLLLEVALLKYIAFLPDICSRLGYKPTRMPLYNQVSLTPP